MRVLLQPAALAALLLCRAAWCQEVVTNEPLTKDQLIATLPVLALRKLDVDKVITVEYGKTNTWMVSAPAAVESVLVSQQIPQPVKLMFKGVSYLPARVDDWQPNQKEAMASAVDTWAEYFKGGSEKFVGAHFVPGNEIEMKSQLISILPRARDVKADEPQVVSANGVGRILAANEIIQISGSKGSETEASKRSAKLDLNTEFAYDIKASYYPLKSIPLLKSDMERLPAVNNAIQEAALKEVAGRI